MSVTHLTWEPHHAPLRLRQVEYVSAMAPSGVLLGDFNAEPDSAEMKHLRAAGFADAWGDGPAGYTFDRVNDYARDADEPSCRIDYVLVRGRGLAAVRMWLAWTEPERTASGAVWPSDHFGVVSDLSIDA
ncbi:endonuclease/exonuclease/phosphatase family protein [Phytohabitans rumicis]|uniref:Endonuclease/exonuclease/phosphatase domain-containing protein n=1 Tax=Phytohabitans rumicis TaxID=1076125 RepID=A0A6V8KWY6_9ACTN|nr:endonuclease/exonuclease/phosphatase family protein [Phytohabitans rumicis]GFJ89593.1 hypothetical protein Prum_032350 [Phytohabitans rumicis]